MTSKESVSRLRETLIQNFSHQASPQVEVPIPTTTTADTNADASGAHVPVGDEIDVTNGTTFDLTTDEADEADEDVWCICGKPDDGRRYVQCSQKETCMELRMVGFTQSV